MRADPGAVLFYQNVEIRERRHPPTRPSPYSLPQADGPAVKLTPRARIALVGWPISMRVNHELFVLSFRIRSLMPPGGGVLVRLTLYESKKPDASGERAQRFLALSIVGSGRIPALVLLVHREHPIPRRRAPRGHVGRDVFIWVTA